MTEGSRTAKEYMQIIFSLFYLCSLMEHKDTFFFSNDLLLINKVHYKTVYLDPTYFFGAEKTSIYNILDRNKYKKVTDS